MIKNKKEIALLKKSAEISDSCIEIIENSLKEDISEKELARRIRKQIKGNNASEAFRTLVACGKRTAKIHPRPYASNKKIKGLCYADFGAKYKGYCSDMTVPFIKGNVTKKEKRIARIVLNAHRLAIRSIKMNENCWKLFDKVNIYLKKNGFELMHGLGHGLGKIVHDDPSIIMPRKKKIKHPRRWQRIKKMVFQPSMVFTIEPGIYVKGLGGCRIENDILMTKDGPKILTNSKLIQV